MSNTTTAIPSTETTVFTSTLHDTNLTEPPSVISSTPPSQTTAPSATEGDTITGLASEAQWLLVAAGILVGVLIIFMLGCFSARWYYSSEKRKVRAKREAEEGIRRGELDDDDLPPLPLAKDEHAEAEAQEGYADRASPDRDLRMAEGRDGSPGSSPGRGGERGGRASPRGRGKRLADPSEAIHITEVVDPADVLAPVDPNLFKSLYESDEDEPPLHHKREASWVETDEDRRKRRARRLRPDKGAARKHFDDYLKANQSSIAAQQKAMYMQEGGDRPTLKNIVNTDDSSSSSDSSNSSAGRNEKILPLSRAEAEQMRIDDLNDKLRERHRISEHFKNSHPHYQYQDPIYAVNKALLATSHFKGRVQMDDTAIAQREKEQEEKYGAIGNNVPWGNREDDVAKDGVAKIHELPWMTSERVKAIAKEHVRSDRKQVKRQLQIEPFVMDDGRIDYDAKPDGPQGNGKDEGNSEGRAISDRASSFRGDRASSVLGGATRRRGGSPSERASFRYDRASALVRGSQAAGGKGVDTGSLGRSFAVRLADFNEGNTRNSALTMDDLRMAREAFGGSANGRDSSRGGDGASSHGERRSALTGDDRRSHRSSNANGRRRARFENDSLRSGEGDRSIRSQEDVIDAGDDDNEVDADDDPLALAAMYYGKDATAMSKQELVDARSLSLLRAQVFELRASVAAQPIDADAAEETGVSTGGAAVGVYNNMNVPVSSAATSPKPSVTIIKSKVMCKETSPRYRYTYDQNGDERLEREEHGMHEDDYEEMLDYADVTPYQWHGKGDEQFFHLSRQPQRRLHRAAEVADAHLVESRTDIKNRIEEAEQQYLFEREERRRKMIAARRLAGLDVDDDDSMSDFSELSSECQGKDLHAHAPVSIREDPNGCKIFRAFASPHQDPYLNML